MNLDIVIVVMLGLALAVATIAWVWQQWAEPSIVSRQEGTLKRQHDRMDVLQAEIDDLRRTIADNHESYEEELAELRAVLDEWWHGMRLVFEQMAAAELVPVWQPKPVPAKRRRVEVPQSALAQRIFDQFTIEEIDDLAFRIGIQSEEIPGRTKKSRANELVQMAFSRGISWALLQQVNELRPNK